MTRGWLGATIAAAGLAVATTLAQQPPPRDTRGVAATGTAAISGVVAVAGERDSRPIPYAYVGLLGIDTGDLRVTSADASGRFQLSRLGAGRYLMSGFKPPYVSLVYGATRPGRPGTPIAVADGEEHGGVVLTLARGGVIAGRITDETGRPAPGTFVGAMPAAGGSLQSQMMSMAFLSSQISDDRGEYRFSGLPPGEYVVAVTWPDRLDPDARILTSADIDEAMRLLGEPARTAGAGPAPAPGTAIVPPGVSSGPSALTGPMAMLSPMMLATNRLTYAPVYYPGTVDIGDAQPVRITGGEERTGIDVVARAIPTSSIAGLVIGPDGQPAANASLRLRPSGQSDLVSLAMSMLSSMAPNVSKDGTFNLTGVAPGRYTLEARTYDRGVNPAALAAGAMAGFTPPKPLLFAATDVVVASGQPLSGITLRLQPGSEVSGRVVFTPTSLAPPADASNVMVSLIPASAGDPLAMISGGAVRAAADGTFTLSGVIPGRYVVNVGVIDPAQLLQWLPQSVTVDGRERLDLPIDVAAGGDVREIVVTLGDARQEVHGTLQDASGRPAPAFTILLFPTSREYWLPNSRRVLATRPGTDGSFSFAGPLGPPPGEYFLAALTELDPGDQYKPAILSEISAGAIRIVVTANQRTRQDIRIAK